MAHDFQFSISLSFRQHSPRALEASIAMNAEPILIARNQTDIFLLPQMANRHGLIAGATGTGKTVTLQLLAESFSAMGVPVFLADVKGDLAGISQPGGQSAKVLERVKQLQIDGYTPAGCPVTLWDVFGEKGHPVRTTISEMGPLLMARLLQLNETQAGVLNIVFRVADENGLLLLDLKDLRAMLQHVGDSAAQFTGTNTRCARVLLLWMQWAMISLPVPLSPVIITVAFVGATRRARSITLAIAWFSATTVPQEKRFSCSSRKSSRSRSDWFWSRILRARIRSSSGLLSGLPR